MPKFKPQPRPPIHPDLAASKYYKRLLPLLKDLRDTTRANLLPALDYYRVARELETNTDGHLDSSPRLFRLAKQRFGEAISQAETKVKWSEKQVSKAVKPSYQDVSNVTKGNLQRMKVPVPHPDPKHQAEYLQRNIELIQTIPERSFSTLARMIDKHIESNATVETLAKAIESRYHVSESQAALIATDQVSKLSSELTHAAFIEAGVTKGTWMSMEDESVRPTHAYANGKTYDLEKGLFVDGEWTQPGMPVACRCWCMPDIEHKQEPEEQPVVAPKETPVEAPQAAPKPSVREAWGEALRFTPNENLQSETISRDLKTITEASPLIVKNMAARGATINIDLKSNSVMEVIRYSPKLRKEFGNVADRLEQELGGPGSNRSIAAIMIGEKHVVISKGGAGSESLLGHEVGHVIDYQASGQIISNTDTWRKPWEKWIKKPAPVDARFLHNYYTDPVNGPRESFAEVYGHVITSGKAAATSRWGKEMVDEMVATLRKLDPKIKIGE
jgi:SPP1 gp7 family putative phage head morphogenesis protein